MSPKTISKVARERWSLTGTRREYAAKLFNQQLYLIGRDVASRHGNLLMHYGCVREASPHRQTPSLYTLNFSTQRRLIFRGFGVFCGNDRLGGIFLRRREFVVEWTAESKPVRKPWIPDFLPPLRRPRTPEQKAAASKLLREIVECFIDYESWIDEEFGYPMRRGQLTHYQRLGRFVQSWHPRDDWEEVHRWITGSP